ncbi:MAG: hypothetical protein HY806_07545, partial [Nitrospirae bacterium]|nr:hypothetical protein [Nitrospirota bacterium]
MKYLKNHRVKSFLTGLFSAVVVLLCFAGSVPAAQVDAVWDGGGGTNYWNTATNWNPNVIPNNGTNTYNVFIGGLYLPDYTVYLNTSPTIDNLTIDTSDSFTVINNSHLYIAGGASAGTITNNGSILLNGSSTYTDLILNSGDVLLTGAGTLTMSNYANNRIFGSSSTYRLTNSAGHTIQGSGLLGNNQMALTNEGTITANQSNALTINPSSSGFTNNGTIRANSGSTLTVNDTLTNLSGTTLTGGTYYVTGTMRLPGAINTNAASIILDGTSSNLYNGTSGTNNALTNLNTNNGSFSILNDRDFTTAGNLTNSGAIIVGDNSIL